MGNPNAPPPTPDDAVHVEIAGMTDVGRLREHNEDAFLISGLGERAVDCSEGGYRGPLPPAGLLFAVADGMGGAASGEVASRMAVETVRDHLRDGYAPDADADALQVGLEGALTSANAKIYAFANQEAKHRGMGTTMTAVLASGGRLCFSQVGDSRAYLLRKNEIVQLTKDQSLINQLIEDGTLTEEEAEKIGGRNIILQALGVEEAVQVDTRHLELLAEDVVLVCSDGLSGMISDEEILQTLRTTPDLAEACRRLVARANDAGGRDNISVIVARFRGGNLRSPAEGTEDLVVRARESAPARGPFPRMKLFLLLAAVGAAVLLALLLLSGGKTPLVVLFNVDGVSGRLVPLRSSGEPEPGGAVPFAIAAGESRLQLEDLVPGDWEITATRPGYRETKKKFRLEAGGNTVEVQLERDSRSISVLVNVPRSVVTLIGDGEQFEYTCDGAKPVVFRCYPGDYQLIVRRRGYKTLRERLTLTAEADLSIDRALEENRGVVVLAGAVPGTRAQVSDQDDEMVFEDDLPPDGKLLLREGEYVLVLQAPRYQDWRRAGVLVEGGATARLEVQQAPRKGKLEIRIGPRARARAEFFEIRQPGVTPKGATIPAPGEGGESVVTYSLEEGTYEIVVGTESMEADLKADETVTVRFP